MSGNGKVPQAAYFYAVDDDGKPIQGSKQSARKENDRPKISRRDSRSEKSRQSYSDSGKYDEGISPGTKGVEVVNMTEKEVSLERRKSSASATKSPKRSSKQLSAQEARGLTKASKSKPKKDEPSHFGIANQTRSAPPVVSTAGPIPLRPRVVTTQTYPSRPLSYHGAITSGGIATGPPLSSSARYQHYTIPPSSYPPPSYPPSSYPSPSYPPSSNYFEYTRTPQAGADYFSPPVTTTPVGARPLHERFGTGENSTYYPRPRPTSAFGTRDYPQQVQKNAYDDGYTSAAEVPVRRRVSISRPSIRTKQKLDDESMPPPRRPSILRPLTTEYYVPPDPPPRRESHDSRFVYRDDPPSLRRPNLRRNSVSYESPDSDRVRVLETANAGRRRTSYYGPVAGSSGSGSGDYVSDKVQQAQTYQEEVTGPTPVPLTADLLKRQQRRQAGSSRSTKSSGSRDESDFRKSATTRTTRSGSNDDGPNITIKVTGNARVMHGATRIDCGDDAEIEIKHQKSVRNGSERGSEYDDIQRDRIEDRKSRVERPQQRSRMSSKSNQSYTRTTTPWI